MRQHKKARKINVFERCVADPQKCGNSDKAYKINVCSTFVADNPKKKKNFYKFV